jgi:hypothetical protein
MPAKPSGEIKTRIVHNTQKNGDIYVLERKTVYDSDKKQDKVLSTKLLSKIPKGSEIPIPTRPKRPFFDKRTEISGNPCVIQGGRLQGCEEIPRLLCASLELREGSL